MTQPSSDAKSPASIEAERRLQVIAALHAYADWLAANPDVPAPNSIDGNAHAHRHYNPDQTRDESLAIARNLIDRHGATKHDSGPDHLWAIVRVPGTGTIPVELTYYVLSPPKPKPAW